MQPPSIVNRCTRNLREVERVERDACLDPSMLVNAKAFEDEVGGLIFTSGLLDYAAQEQEHCEFPVVCNY